ncbi:MAG: hypothetical protein QUS13_02740 [Smithella sp.]|nr:hypothetical protein [Smithella sp.]
MNVKAIETIYRGYRFRSRLEARWAVFFDALVVPFEYETEGFVLDDGTKYLPDFWLPTLKMWFEAKGELTLVEHELSEDSGLFLRQHEKLYSCPELDLMRRFRSSQPWPVALSAGQPGDHRIWFFGWDMSYSSAGEYEDKDAVWCCSRGRVTLKVNITARDREIYSDCLYGDALKHFTDARDHGYTLGPIDKALRLARQARFEHGEKPMVFMGDARV